MSSLATYDAHETARMHALDGCRLAPFRRRLAAFLLDLAIGFILFLALVIVTAWLLNERVVFHLGGLRIEVFEVVRAGHAPLDVHLTFFESLIGIVWWVVYFGLSTYVTNGQTPGKRLLHIRVVSVVHERLTLWHSVERALGYGASMLEFGFGFLQYFVHPNRRTVHDRIAETIVVDDHV
ncbi:MAG TPA: RDD family protein [Vicinamibacterales bacterium]|nr:RDD family protein [Vicinamibacterales bacterium]